LRPVLLVEEHDGTFGVPTSSVIVSIDIDASACFRAVRGVILSVSLGAVGGADATCSILSMTSNLASTGFSAPCPSTERGPLTPAACPLDRDFPPMWSAGP
jgi:hypothetical protein